MTNATATLNTSELKAQVQATTTDAQLDRLLHQVCKATCTCEAGCLKMAGHKAGCRYRILVFSIRNQAAQFVGENLYAVA